MPKLSPIAAELIGIARAMNAVQRASLDPRDPDPSKPGIFRDHNCWKCKDGTLPCAKGHTLNCEFPHARND